MYITYGPPNEYRFRTIFYLNGVGLRTSCLFFTESSHDIVLSTRYIPRDRSHMHNTDIELNSGAVMATDNA